MATAQPQIGKPRVSKAAKRKAKRVVEEPSDDDDDEEMEVAEGEKLFDKEAKGPAKTARKTKANRLAEMEEAADEEEKEPRGVLYVGHIPDGFFEPQMKKFFAQFGKVTRLRISRSKKNAKSKGYAFVEFEEESVAKIVAETMQGYLLFDKTLVCHMLPKDKQHPLLFKGYRRMMVNSEHKRRRKHMSTYNDRPTVEVDGEQLPRRTQRQADRRTRSEKKLAGVLANLGVEYDFSGANEVVQSRGAKSPKKGAAPSPKLSPSSPKLAAAGSPKLAAAGVGLPKKKKRKTSA
jgi:RNA recognition motif-containing protein